MSAADTVKFIVAMVVMMNPLGSLSIFLDLTKKLTRKTQRNVALKCGVAMIAIMLITVWSGEELLSCLGIKIPSFRFAGGIILLMIGLSMLQSKESPVSHTAADDAAAHDRDAIAIVPLSLPIIIGPGAISTLIIWANDNPLFFNKVEMSGTCILLAFSMCMILYFGHPIAKIVGMSVIKVVTRIMGMIIMSLAVGMMAEGATALIPALN
jgi:multiple antibiotic resistance protein